MANNQPSDEEIQFRKRARRRLVGAIALALLMVTVLPMLLDEQEAPPTTTAQPEVAISIPSQDGEDFSSRIVPVEPADEAAPQAESQAADGADKLAGTADEKPVATETPAPAAPAGNTEGASSQHQGTEFVVQVGVYSDAGNAKALQEKLAAKGLKIYAEKLQTDNGAKTRLRMGPYASRAEAEAGLASLKAAGANGIVKPK